MPPNILVILCDQLRRQALSCYGDPNIQTPHIDALAERGVRFDAACSTYPICVPFRFSMLTGQYAHSRQVPGIEYRMSPAERTLADEFNAADYHTAYVGKWHLYGGHGPSMFNMPVPRANQGRFEKWLGFEFRNDFFDSCYFEDDDPTPIRIDGYQTDGLFDAAIDYLTKKQDRSRPFFSVLSVEAPHPPIEAPPEYEKAWENRELIYAPNFLTAVHHDTEKEADHSQSPRYEKLLRDHRIYYAMIQNLDDNVGRMMTALREAELADNTIVVFLSDHGELMGSHNLRSKQYPYEESCGIPLVACGPGIAAGKVIAEPVCTEDLFPTLCGLAGINPRDPLPGQDVSPLMRGQSDRLDREGVMLEFVAELRQTWALHKRPYRGFRSRRYKYTVQQNGNEGMKPWQFFDLTNDPFELNNLVDDPAAQEMICHHHGLLRQRMAETADHAWLAAAHGYDDLNAWRVGTRSQPSKHKG